jgi:hypothetical protein
MKHLRFLFISIFLLLLLGSGYKIFENQLSTKTNANFSASGNCELCHGASSFALRDAKGNDVSPVTNWRSTMLANSSNDPFWRAKVKHEGLSNPEHKNALENVCTRCHAPMGMMNALLNNHPEYNIDSLKNDEMGQDGISCTLCHQIKGLNEQLFSGTYEINVQKEIYGPYTNPITQQMVMNTGFTPVYNEIINDSKLCGSCHTLITNSVDEDGEFTGNTFIEQALYHEWENSIYAEQNISCQECHIPRINESIKISSRPGFINGRQPFGVHGFIGGNSFMLNLLNANHEELGLAGGKENFETTIQQTKTMLTQNTINLEIYEASRTNDSIFIEVSLKNKAGHKFPTGFPSRRGYLEFLVIANSDTLFHSGNKNSEALNHNDDEKFEPHYKKISREKQVQIFEFVMGDSEGEVTTILERAFEPLKDNRIPPEGFSQTHANYDTVRVVGGATSDNDYMNGTGNEKIIYAFPLTLLETSAYVKAVLHYETVPESWVKDLFEYSEEDEDIDKFKKMYNQMQRKSEIVAKDSMYLALTDVKDVNNKTFRIYPNPTSGKIRFQGINEDFTYSIFSSDGVCVKSGKFLSVVPELNLSLPPGNYVFIAETKYQRHNANLIIPK